MRELIDPIRLNVASAPATREPWLKRKRLFQIHGWLGMTFGSLLFVICFSGAAAALSHEIDWLLNPSLRAWPESAPLGWESWMKAARTARPDWKPRWVSAPLNRYFAAEIVAEAPSGRLRRIYVNPYSGVVQGESSYFNVQRFLRDFHRMLNLPGSGLYLVSSFGFALLFSVVTGLLFYKNWRKNLFRLRVNKGPKALWSDVHRLAGVWSFVFAVIIAVTGIWYLVEHAMQTNGLMRAEAPLPKLTAAKLKAHGPTPRPLGVDELLKSSKRAFPELDVRTVWFPIEPDDPVHVDGQSGVLMVRDRASRVYLDPYDGEVLKLQRAESLSLYRRWEDTADPLHFGDFGGLFTKVLWSVFGFAIPVLIMTGAYLSIRQSRPAKWAQDESDLIVPDNLKWWRLRRWTASTWLSLLVFAAALYTIVPAATRYRTPMSPNYEHQGKVSLGPWTLSVAAAKQSIRAEFLCEGSAPSFQSISLSMDEAGLQQNTTTAMQPVSMKARGGYWFAEKLTLPTGNAGALWITIKDWEGATHRNRLMVSKSSLKNSTERLPEEGPYTGIGTWFFLFPFLLVLVGAFGIWIARFGTWRPSDS